LVKQSGFEGLVTNAILLQFSKQRNRAIACYQEFVSQGRTHQIWGDLKRQIYLGDQKFVEQHIQSLDSKTDRLAEVPRKQRRMPAESLRAYEEEDSYRDDAIIAAYLSGGYTMKEISDYLAVIIHRSAG
jgi:hypothetical protein